MAAAQLDQAKAALIAAAAADRGRDARGARSTASSRRSTRHVGDTVAMMPPTPILTITDLDRLEVRFAVPEALVAFVQDWARRSSA